LRLPRHLPFERRALIDGLLAVTFDFGNTLVPFPAASMSEVVRLTAETAAGIVGCRPEEFVRVWAEERQRQLDENVPEGRDADMDVRVVRVIARLRGVPSPGPDRWEDASIAAACEPGELSAILNAYARAFVAKTPVPRGIEPMLARLAGRYRLAVLSNWPLAIAVERYLDAAGWSPHLTATVISHRVGAIKPRPLIFEAAARALGVESGPAILHVGDDPGADIVGAHAVGWRAAWVRIKPEVSPLPFAVPTANSQPDLIVDNVLDIEAAIS
jgi:HAD superfamily hydrolase (TIGR01549 family)